MRFVLKFLVTPVSFVIAIFFLVNSCDRKLNPEIEQFVNAARKEIPNGENAYFALLGHNSAAGLDAHIEGAAIVRELEEKFVADRDVMSLSRKEIFGSPALVVVGEDDLLDMTCSENCFDIYRTRSGEFRALLRENSELVNRYRDLYQYRRFNETTTLPFMAEDFTSVRETQKIVLFGIAIQGVEDGVDAALSTIEQDISFWRMVLVETRRLVNKMTATSALKRDIRLLSGIISVFEIDAEQAARISAVAAPLVQEEWSLSLAMRGEWAYHLEQLTGSLRGAKMKGEKLYKENATKNLAFDLFRQESEIYDLPAPEWLRRYQLFQADKEKRFDFNLLQLFYNPIGKMMLPIVLPDFTLFPMKAHDLDGYFAVLRAQLAIKRQAVGPEGIPAFLAESCPEYCDPYTRQSLTWNAEERSLSFLDPVFEKPRILTLH